MKRFLKLTLTVLLVAMTLTLSLSPAFAISFKVTEATGWVQATEPVNVRKGPDTSYERVTWLNTGDKVERTGVTNNGWTRVKLADGQIAYVHSKYVKVVSGGGSTGSGTTQFEAAVRLNVRTGPSTSYKLLGTLSVGEVVTLISVSNNWAKINWNGTVCYAYYPYLTPHPDGGTGGTGGTSGTSGQYYSTANLNVRTGPSTSYTRIGTLAVGEVVTVLSLTGNWAKINWNGTVCYAFFQYLKPYTGSGGGTSTQNPDGYLYATTDLNVFKTASANSTVLGTIKKGERVTKIGNSGVFAIISWGTGSGYAYVSDQYLQKDPVSGTTTGRTTMYVTLDLDVFKSASASSSIIGTLKRGDKVIQVGTQGIYAIIEWGTNAYGYVFAQYLQTTAISSTTADSGDMYVTVRSTVYDGPGTNYTALGTLYVGDVVYKYATYGNYAMIRWNNGYAYVLDENLRLVSSGSGSNYGAPNQSVKDTEEKMLDFMRKNLYSDVYEFHKVNGLYTLNSPAKYEIGNNYYFTSNRYVDITYTYGSNRIYFTWYRDADSRSILNTLTSGWNINDTFRSNGITYYYKDNTSSGYTEICWLQDEYCFYAQFPGSSFNRAEIASVCDLRFKKLT